MTARRGAIADGVLSERNFRLFFIGFLTSLTGSAMLPVVLTFAILGQGGTTRDVGLVLASETAPLVLFLLAGGVLADRLPRKAVMVGADLLRGCGQLSMVALLWSGHAPIPAMMGLAAVLGGGQAFFGPALSGLLPQIVSAERLQPANAHLGIARSIAQIGGPAVAGIIVAAGGAPWAVLFDAATYGVSALCIARLDPPPRLRPDRTESFLQQLRLGWDEFRSHTWLWVIVAQFGLFHMLVLAPFMVLGATVAKTTLGGAETWGFVLGAQGCGALLGGLMALKLRPKHPLALATLSTFTLAPPLALLAWPAPLWSIMAAAAVAGAGTPIFAVMFDTTMHRKIPPVALSRVSSYDYLGSFALLPLGYALVGPLSSVLGIPGTLWFSAAWLVLSSGVVFAVPAVRRLTWEGGAPISLATGSHILAERRGNG